MKFFKKGKTKQAYLVSWVTTLIEDPSQSVYGQSELLLDKKWEYGDTQSVCRFITEAVGEDQFKPVTISGVHYLGTHKEQNDD